MHVFFNLLSIVIFLCNISLSAHGFHPDTIIYGSNDDKIQTVEQVILSAQKNKNLYVKSYDQDTNQLVEKRPQAICLVQISSYCTISLNGNSPEDIVCSPIQSFYRTSDCVWIPARELVVGDTLLCEDNNFISVSAIKTVQEPLVVYMIEVEDTHTFLVGRYGLVTHNIIIPAATLGFSIPFSTGCGSGLGIVFGPIGFVGGIVFSGLVGIAVKAFKDHNVNTCFDVSFRPDAVSTFMKENDASAPTKTVEGILSTTKPGRTTKGKARQYEKDGTYEDALKDFESLGSTDVKNMVGKEGKVGILPDGRTVNVRLKSTDGRSTLEIQPAISKGKIIKIRYNGNKS